MTRSAVERQQCFLGKKSTPWMNRTVHRSLLAGSYCTECPSVITGRCLGCQWQPGGSTLGSHPPAGSGWSLSDGPWWTGSFWGGRLHASPDWTQSSQPDPPGAVGSSPWDSDMRVQIIEWMVFHRALVDVCPQYQRTHAVGGVGRLYFPPVTPVNQYVISLPLPCWFR